MKTEKMGDAILGGDRKPGLHLLRRSDGSLRLKYDVTEPGLHSIMIMVNGKHVYGSPNYCYVQKDGDSYSTVYAADLKTIMDSGVLEQNRCNAENEVHLQSSYVEKYPDNMLWHNICTDLSCHYSRGKQSLLTNSQVLDNQNIGLDESFDGEPYSGMRLPVVIPDSSHPAFSYAYHDEQKGNMMFSSKSDIKHEILSDEEEWYSKMNKESTGFYHDQLMSGDTPEQVEAIDLSLHHCSTDCTEQASENQSNATPDSGAVESESQENAEKDRLTADYTSDDNPESGNESNVRCSKQQPVQHKLHKRLQQTSEKVAGAGIVNETIKKSALICPEPHCNQQFKTQIRLLVHKQVHEFLKSLGGPFSDGNLSSLVTLEAVKKPDLSTDVLMWYKCPAQSCMKCFKSTASLEKHLVLHCTPLYKCTEPGCTKCFHLKKTLVLHKSEHTQEKHICTKCGKSYRSKKHLQAHMRYHTDNSRKYVCTVPGCNSRFNLNRYLQQHMFTHKTTFDYLCQICGKAFKRNECLRAHLLSKSHKKIEQSL